MARALIGIGQNAVETIVPKTVPPGKSRQGSRGLPVLIVLVAGLALAMAVWGALEIWGEAIDAPSNERPGGVTVEGNEQAPIN
ncbi:hypothetical protein [Mesorhizobium sp. WSM2239]|jgi:hypothetical protein|uniref:Uncharacterized protein n=2 Tax=unclassified Mesorhizobium TaxID=325217 RepID=A0AAU8DBD5_9HYPH